MKKIKALLEKHREIVLYLIFGVLTTLVGWGVYFAIFWGWKALFSIPPSDVSSTVYLVGYTVAQIIQWIAAVLFAFFTNRKWVFTDADRSVSTGRQLLTFSGGRVLTLGIDYLVTYFGGRMLAAALPSITHASILGAEINLADVIAKVVAAVIVIVCNYVFSKILVFKKVKKKE